MEGVAHQEAEYVANRVVENIIAEVKRSWEEVAIVLPMSAHSSAASPSTTEVRES